MQNLLLMCSDKEKIGLYPGSFNPLHTGHLIVAQYMLQYVGFDKIWFVVSPHNPLKDKDSLEQADIRLHLAKLAVKDNPSFEVSDAEFHLPEPSYTINTLKYFSDTFKDKQFSLIMGQDSICSLHKWKDYRSILDGYNIYVYPRPDSTDRETCNHPNVHMTDAPMVDISSSYIRKSLQQGRDIRYLVNDEVYKEIAKKGFYKQ